MINPTIPGVRTLGDALRHFVQHSTSCTRLTNSSAFGTIYTLTSTSKAFVETSILSNTLDDASRMLIKVGYIGNGKINVFGADKNLVTIKSFQDEVKITELVYNNSLNSAFDPICPHPIKSYIHAPSASDAPGSMWDNLRKYPDLNTLLTQHHLAIIFMEFGNGVTVDTFFPGWGHQNDLLNHSYANVDSMQSIAMLNYAYQLIRLQSLGIYHDDSHLQNALVCKYVDVSRGYQGYGVLLLDFGMSKPIPIAQNNSTYPWYTRRNWFSYKAVEGVYNQMMAGTLPMKRCSDSRTISVGYDRFCKEMKEYRTRTYLQFFRSITQNDNLLSDIRGAVKSNIKLFPGLEKFAFLAGYQNSSKDEETKAWLFRRANIERKAMTVDVTKLDIAINGATNCCQASDSNYYNYLVKGNAYNWDYVNKLPKSIRKGSINKDLLTQPNGVYLWVIGCGPDSKTNLFVISVSSPGEIGTKHAHLMKYAKIQSFYLAGELKKKNSTISFNLSSGTFMFHWLKTKYTTAGGLDTVKLNSELSHCGEVASMFFKLVLFSNKTPITYRYLNTTIHASHQYLEPTFVNPDNLCDLARTSSLLTGINPSLDTTSTNCIARNQPKQLLGGNGQEDDVDIGNHAKLFIFPSQLYDDLVEIPPEVVTFIEEKKLENVLDPLLYAIKAPDIFDETDVIHTGILQTGLSQKEMTELKPPTSMISMIAGTTRSRRTKRVKQARKTRSRVYNIATRYGRSQGRRV